MIIVVVFIKREETKSMMISDPKLLLMLMEGLLMLEVRIGIVIIEMEIKINIKEVKRDCPEVL